MNSTCSYMAQTSLHNLTHRDAIISDLNLVKDITLKFYTTIKNFTAKEGRFRKIEQSIIAIPVVEVTPLLCKIATLFQQNDLTPNGPGNLLLHQAFRPFQSMHDLRLIQQIFFEVECILYYN